MRIMVCEAYLSGQLVGMYPDPRIENCRYRFWKEDAAGFQARVHAFFMNLFGTEAMETKVLIGDSFCL